MASDERLYGQPGNEILEFDPDTVVAYAIDDGAEPGSVITIEEWSTTNIGRFLPDLAAHACEYAADVCGVEDAAEELDAAAQHPEVIAAAEALRDAIYRHVHYRFAHRKLRTGTCVVPEFDEHEFPVTKPVITWGAPDGDA